MYAKSRQCSPIGSIPSQKLFTGIHVKMSKKRCFWQNRLVSQKKSLCHRNKLLSEKKSMSKKKLPSDKKFPSQKQVLVTETSSFWVTLLEKHISVTEKSFCHRKKVSFTKNQNLLEKKNFLDSSKFTSHKKLIPRNRFPSKKSVFHTDMFMYHHFQLKVLQILFCCFWLKPFATIFIVT